MSRKRFEHTILNEDQKKNFKGSWPTMAKMLGYLASVSEDQVSKTAISQTISQGSEFVDHLNEILEAEKEAARLKIFQEAEQKRLAKLQAEAEKEAEEEFKIETKKRLEKEAEDAEREEDERLKREEAEEIRLAEIAAEEEQKMRDAIKEKTKEKLKGDKK